MDFGSHFGIEFQHFPEWLKAMKSMTVPHFQWFLTIQKLSCCMFFSFIFHVFPEPLPESIFRGSRRRSCLQGLILEPFSIFSGAQNRPLGRHFHSKCPLWVTRRCETNAPGANPQPKRSQNAPKSNFFKFRTDFLWISDWFVMDFSSYLQICFGDLYRFSILDNSVASSAILASEVQWSSPYSYDFALILRWLVFNVVINVGNVYC